MMLPPRCFFRQTGSLRLFSAGCSPWPEGPGQRTSALARRTRLVDPAIEQALVASHRHVFGVLVCFVLLPGPCGAVLYCLAAELAAIWGRRSEDPNDAFAAFAREAFAVVDWLPLRISALLFAVVGNFEDAMFSWRTRDMNDTRHSAIVLASGAGALGVRLSGCNESNGEAADTGHMHSAVALVWRALLLWLLVLFLFGFAGLLAA